MSNDNDQENCEDEKGKEAVEVQASSVSSKKSSRLAIVITRLLVWVIFGVIFGCLPLIVDGVTDTFSAGGFDLNFLLIQGGLFIISAAMAAGAIGELFVADLPQRERNYRIAAGGSCLLLCIGNTAAYAASATSVACLEAEQNLVKSAPASLLHMAAAQRDACVNTAAFLHPTLAFHLSIWFFVPTILVSAACIGMAAGR
jgi:hypothetical protein